MLPLYLFLGVILFHNMLFFTTAPMIPGNYPVVEAYAIVPRFIHRELWYRCMGFQTSVTGYRCTLHVTYKMSLIMANIRTLHLMYILCILHGIQYTLWYLCEVITIYIIRTCILIIQKDFRTWSELSLSKKKSMTLSWQIFDICKWFQILFFYFDFDLKSTVILRFGIDKVKPYIRLIQIYIKAHEYTQRKETIFLFKWFLTLRIHTQIKIKIKP